MSVTHDPDHEGIVVKGSEEGSQASETLLVDGEEDVPDVDDVATDDAGDAAPPQDAPAALQAALNVDQPSPPPPYGSNHPRCPNDIHRSKCKPCRQRDSILLCDYDACCASCFKLPNDVFDQMLNDRKENARKLQFKRDHLAKKTQQLDGTRPSSRLASAGTSTSSTPAEPSRRLSSEEVCTLLQTP